MKLYLKTKDYSFSGEEFQLVRDETRDMLLTQPVPENLVAFYEGDNYISHTDSKSSVMDSVYQLIKLVNIRKKIQLIENQIDKSKKILDIGAGTGDFLYYANKKGFEIYGVEPNAKARARARSKGIDLEKSLSDISETRHQVITLWHVLEHLPDLTKQIENVVGMLAENGIVVVAVPNFRSWDASHYREYWAGYDVPRHLWHFSRVSIKTLFKEHGMEVRTIKPMWFDAFYVSLLSEKYKGNKFYLIAAFLKGLWSNIHAMFTKEYSSLIYILEKKKK